MDRRDSIKSLLLSSLGGGMLLTGCDPKISESGSIEMDEGSDQYYGRTPEEMAHDEELFGEQYFTEREIATLAILCDVILPSSESYKSAADAEVPAFIEFIAKDIPRHQLPIRGGLMWLDNWARKEFEFDFASCCPDQQITLIDQIAYPEDAEPDMGQGVKFFSLMRNLVLTGFYTTKFGIDELQYKGNNPNVWDGVPEDVLKKHGLSYDPDWLAKCVDQETRDQKAQWDEDGNLI